jgi:hypothetical protein
MTSIERDLVERLRKSPYMKNLTTEAADALASIRAERDEAVAALKPFARAARNIPDERDDKDYVSATMQETLDDETVARIGAASNHAQLIVSIDGINAGHFRAARAIAGEPKHDA